MRASASSPKLWTNFLRPFTPPRLTEWESDFQSAGRSSRATMAACGPHAITAREPRFAFPFLAYQRTAKIRLLQRMRHEKSVGCCGGRGQPIDQYQSTMDAAPSVGGF